MCRLLTCIQVMGQHAGSVRDYRKYLSSNPRPSDTKEVQAELDDMIETKKQEMKAEQTRRDHPRTGGGAASYGGQAPRTAPSDPWDSDEEDRFRFFKVR